jgi:hypothetical protein
MIDPCLDWSYYPVGGNSAFGAGPARHNSAGEGGPFLVRFVAYRVSTVTAALNAAGARGVGIRVLLEASEARLLHDQSCRRRDRAPAYDGRCALRGGPAVGNLVPPTV